MSMNEMEISKLGYLHLCKVIVFRSEGLVVLRLIPFPLLFEIAFLLLQSLGSSFKSTTKENSLTASYFYLIIVSLRSSNLSPFKVRA
jgi:hypothetical protein